MLLSVCFHKLLSVFWRPLFSVNQRFFTNCFLASHHQRITLQKAAKKTTPALFRGNRSIPDFEVQHLPYAVIIFIILVLWPKWPFMSMTVKWELPKFGSKVSMRFESLMASQAMFLDPPTLHLIISFKVGFTWTWLWKIIAKKLWKMWTYICMVIFVKLSICMLINFTLGQNWSVW